MADGKREGLAVAVASPREAVAMAQATRGGNPLEELSARVKAIEARFCSWMAKQPIHIVVSTTVRAVQGGALGGLVGSLTTDGGSPFPVPQPPPNANPQAMASLKQAQALAGGPLVQARNFAVMTGANMGISCVIGRIRGAEDIQGRTEKWKSLFKRCSIEPANVPTLATRMAAHKILKKILNLQRL